MKKQIAKVEVSGDGRVLRHYQLRVTCSYKYGLFSCLVTPGIRMAGDDGADQRRVVTPSDALAMGADYLVIGRSITAAEDPLAALERVHHHLGFTPYDHLQSRKLLHSQ